MYLPIRENKLLASLTVKDRERLISRMTDVTFGHKDVVYKSGAPIDYVYFPRSGVLSAIIIMLDGATVEVGAIGQEGMTGIASFLGATRSLEEVICQVPLVLCRRLPMREFEQEIARNEKFRELVSQYAQAVMIASSWYTACNRLHPVLERCARWLLMSHDRMGSDEFSLTQEFLSAMLGVRRATATVTAGKLQSAGLISYRHGRIRILDRHRLEKASCECYTAIHNAFNLKIE